MNKQHILDEVRRTAKDGNALGSQAFTTATGIREHDWRGKFWARWRDAVVEAGCTPDEWNAAHGESLIVESVVKLTRKMAKYPTLSEMALEHVADNNFPSKGPIQALCGKAELTSKLIEFCRTHEGY
jgi:hypothetical protein